MTFAAIPQFSNKCPTFSTENPIFVDFYEILLLHSLSSTNLLHFGHRKIFNVKKFKISQNPMNHESASKSKKTHITWMIKYGRKILIVKIGINKNLKFLEVHVF